MIFKLTDSLTDKILFAMEDQNQVYAVDAKDSTLVGAELADEDTIYTLPFWTSDRGFKVLEDFTSNLKNKKVHSELRLILQEGRGVFRNFKNRLKSYPEIEHSFYIFKQKEMKAVVQDWYDSLCEGWGLEKLDLEIEEYEDLVSQDFVFTRYNHQRDNDCVLCAVNKVADELGEELPVQFAPLAKTRWLSQFDCSGEDADGFVCRSLTDDFAGCVLFSQCQSPSTNTAFLTGLLVVEKYRGLGIARELMEKCISGLHEKKFKWLLIATNFIPQILEPLFERLGFKKMGNVFAADLTKI